MSRKRLNDIVFDPTMQPGHESRYKSLDSVMGEQFSSKQPERSNERHILKDPENPYKKYKSLQNPKVKPSIGLRKKGYNPY